MKAFIILTDGDIHPDQVSVIAEKFNTVLLSEITPRSVHINYLDEEDLMKAIIHQVNVGEVAIKKVDRNLEIAKELQLKAFCKDVLGTIGKYPQSNIADYRDKFITWLISNRKVLHSEIVKNLAKKLTPKQSEILHEYGLDPMYIWIRDVYKLLKIEV